MADPLLRMRKTTRAAAALMHARVLHVYRLKPRLRVRDDNVEFMLPCQLGSLSVV